MQLLPKLSSRCCLQGECGEHNKQHISKLLTDEGNDLSKLLFQFPESTTTTTETPTTSNKETPNQIPPKTFLPDQHNRKNLSFRQLDCFREREKHKCKIFPRFPAKLFLPVYFSRKWHCFPLTFIHYFNLFRVPGTGIASISEYMKDFQLLAWDGCNAYCSICAFVGWEK